MKTEVDWTVSDLEQKAFADMQKKHDDSIIHVLRNNCVPPIKGNITKGKVKWRGLALAYQNDFKDGTMRTLILQRGKQIGIIEQHIKINFA